MKFLADEDFPLPGVQSLSEAGHDATAIASESLGISDEHVLERAAREERILLTFDRDHGRLLYRHGAPVPEGVVYFRFVPSSLEEPAEYLLALLERPDHPISDTFTVVRRDRVRQRPLPRTQ